MDTKRRGTVAKVNWNEGGRCDIGNWIGSLDLKIHRYIRKEIQRLDLIDLRTNLASLATLCSERDELVPASLATRRCVKKRVSIVSNPNLRAIGYLILARNIISTYTQCLHPTFRPNNTSPRGHEHAVDIGVFLKKFKTATNLLQDKCEKCSSGSNKMLSVDRRH